MDQFSIKTEVFEGPLDLLLNLIEKRKLLINDISLSEVTNDFIQHIEGGAGINVGHRAQFILIASTLVLIKSKSLLPILDLTSEEEESIDDLEARLKEYKRIKELSRHVAERFGSKIMFPVTMHREVKIEFSPDESITKPGLVQAIKGLLATMPKIEKVPEKIIQKVISLEQMIDDLSGRIQKSLKMSFKEFAKDKKEKVNIIVSFLAMLELVKQGSISVKQEGRYGDIEMESSDVGLPSYG